MEKDREGLILLLLQEGNQRDAIELYREEAGVSAEEAARAIAELSHRHGVRVRRNWLLPWFVAGLAVLLGSALAFHG